MRDCTIYEQKRVRSQHITVWARFRNTRSQAYPCYSCCTGKPGNEATKKYSRARADRHGRDGSRTRSRSIRRANLATNGPLEEQEEANLWEMQVLHFHNGHKPSFDDFSFPDFTCTCARDEYLISHCIPLYYLYLCVVRIQSSLAANIITLFRSEDLLQYNSQHSSSWLFRIKTYEAYIYAAALPMLKSLLKSGIKEILLIILCPCSDFMYTHTDRPTHIHSPQATGDRMYLQLPSTRACPNSNESPHPTTPSRGLTKVPCSVPASTVLSQLSMRLEFIGQKMGWVREAIWMYTGP